MTKKQTWEERVYLAYTSTALFIIERSQGRNLAEADAEAVGIRVLFTGLLLMAFSG